ncbi:MAG: hypothetical protein GC178_00525 [Flavobacteriales bacterium]|nr:hypothetical protein [Flavobacteriales bacterium]
MKSFAAAMSSLKSAIPILILLVTSCSRDEEITQNMVYDQYVTIDQGIWGSVIYREGNWMPPVGKNAIWYPVERDVLFCRPINILMEELPQNLSKEIIDEHLIFVTRSDHRGFYEMNLPTGLYTVLVKEDTMYYFNYMDGQGNLSPVNVDTNATTPLHLIIDYNAVY